MTSIDELHVERAVMFAAETDTVMRVALELDAVADAIVMSPPLSFDADHFADLDERQEDAVHDFAHAFLAALDEEVVSVVAPTPAHLARYSADALTVLSAAPDALLEKPLARSGARGEAVDPAKGDLTQSEVLHTPPNIVRTLTIEVDDDVVADAILNMVAHLKGARVTVGKAGGA